MLYERPEQPPPRMPRRSPPSVGRNAFLRHGGADALHGAGRDVHALLAGRQTPPAAPDLSLLLPSSPYFAATAAGTAAVSPTLFFFFQSPIAARIASSASTEQ